MLLLHAGFPKTGTTSLQRIFAQEASVAARLMYLGPTAAADNPRLKTARSRVFINFVREVKLGRSSDRLAQKFRDLCASLPNSRTFTDVIISEEMLSQSATEDWAVPALWQNVERVVEATQVERTKVVVLLGVRDAASMLPSDYAQNRRKYQDRFPDVNDFLQNFLQGGWPGYAERFDVAALRSGASALGLRLRLLPMAELQAAQWVGQQGLLDDVFPWSRRHPLPASNVRQIHQGQWRSDGISAYDRVEVFARRLPIRMPPELLYRGVRAALNRVQLDPGQDVVPDPALLEAVRQRFGSVEAAAQEQVE